MRLEAGGTIRAKLPAGTLLGDPWIEARHGSILVTGSMGSKRGMAMNPAYVASKHGVLGLVRAIAVEMAPHGVRANCIIPGFINTEALDRIPPEQAGKIIQRVPQRRMGSPEELAEVKSAIRRAEIEMRGSSFLSLRAYGK